MQHSSPSNDIGFPIFLLKIKVVLENITVKLPARLTHASSDAAYWHTLCSARERHRSVAQEASHGGLRT